MTALFISDLHLTAGDAETTRRFVEFMDGPARTARELYILGDLFEAWIGDDDDDPRLTPIVAALRRLTDAGVACALMHGNRDFLLGQRFCALTGTPPARRLRAHRLSSASPSCSRTATCSAPTTRVT